MVYKYKKALTIVSLCLILLLNVSTVSAKNSNSDKDWEKRRAFIEENIIVLGSQGPDKVDEWLQANGIHKVESINSIQPASAPGSVKITYIDGYYDGVAKKYLVKGWWTWNDISLVDSNAGALDGVSLAMTQTNWDPVTGYILESSPAGIAVYDQNGTYYPYAGNTSKIDKSGIVYTFQDSWSGTNYIGYNGQAWFWMLRTPDQLPIYIKMDLEHTWTSASLKDFGFSWPVGSPPTISMTFDTTPENIKIADQKFISSWRYQY